MTTSPSRVADDEDRHAADYRSSYAVEASTSSGDEKALPQEDATAAAAKPSVHAEQSYPAGLRYWLAVLALCLAIFLITLDSTIIATATPYITTQFNSLRDIGWYANIYPMAIAMSQLTYGKLSARYPIRWIYSIAMLLFLVGSALCASAPSSPALIVGRAISGLGSSGLLIGAYSLVAYLAPPAKRPTFFSLISASRGVAVTCGPLIGGALTEDVSWRWNFYINLPLGVAIYLAFLYAVRPPKRAMESFTSWGDFLKTLDLVGLTALLGFVSCLFLALQWGGITYSWASGRIIALLVISGVCGAAFVGIEISQDRKAMLPPYVFLQRTVLSASFYSLCNAGAIFTITYYFPIWLQAVKEKSPLESGVSTLPWVITSTIVALGGGVLISKVGHTYVFMFIGSVFGCIGSGLFTTLEPNTSRGKWIGYQILYAVGSSLSSFTPLVVAQNAVPLADVSIASGMLVFCQTLGSALFVSIAQALFSNDLSKNLQTLGVGFDASTVATAGVASLTQGLSQSAKNRVLQLINDALTSSWLMCVVLSSISIVGALGVEHQRKETATPQQNAEKTEKMNTPTHEQSEQKQENAL